MLQKPYTIGDDVLSQSSFTENGFSGTDYLLYDGHGSTRQLANAFGVVTAKYAYDAYGVMLGQTADAQQAQATSLLYSGERFDTALQQYHLRARNYNPANGQFTSLDPYAGNTYDPQSLHKYAYCHSDPVNYIDPSGEMVTLAEFQVAIVIGSTLLGCTIGGFTNGTKGALIGAFMGACVGACVAIHWGPSLFLWASVMWDKVGVWLEGLSSGCQQYLSGPMGRVSLQRLQSLHDTSSVRIFSRLSGSFDPLRGLHASTSRALADAGNRASLVLHEFNVPIGVLKELERIGALRILQTSEFGTSAVGVEYEFTVEGAAYITQFWVH